MSVWAWVLQMNVPFWCLFFNSSTLTCCTCTEWKLNLDFVEYLSFQFAEFSKSANISSCRVFLDSVGKQHCHNTNRKTILFHSAACPLSCFNTGHISIARWGNAIWSNWINWFLSIPVLSAWEDNVISIYYLMIHEQILIWWSCHFEIFLNIWLSTWTECCYNTKLLNQIVLRRQCESEPESLPLI